MNQLLLHRINAIEEQMDDEHQERELLCQCAASGQMDERQIHAHRQAGELQRSAGWPVLVASKPDAMPTPDGMLLATGLAAVAVIVVLFGVLGYLLAPFVWPVIRPFFAAFFN